MKMLIMGAPGSGKGTQSEILVRKLKIPAISTGAMLRTAIAEGTDVGKEAEKYINDGNLVPDEIMISLVLDRISKSDCKDGYILDGFPRTLAQAKAMTEAGINIDFALMIDVPDQDITDRIGGRRVCPKCGATYHIKFKPSSKGEFCDQCGGKLEVRADDAPETVLSRLKTYHEITAPVINYYKDMGKLVTVKAVNGVEETTVLVLEALGKQND
ncbi:MAG: adenylate kinase [Clostridia bacterium]|nr:adenylate kinase [Clostridia bacterium]